MKSFVTFIIAVVLQLGYTGSSKAPFVTPCRVSDGRCQLASAQAAVPTFARGIFELGVETLDPMKIERIKANQAGLKMDFRNVVVKELAGCIFEKLKRPTDTKLSMELRCNSSLTGDYKLSGRLLLLPIEGDGTFQIKIKNINVKIAYDMEVIPGEGKDSFWKIKDVKKSYTVSQKTGHAHFRFENLFNGNKALSDTIHSVANAGWYDILSEVGPPVVNAIIDKIVEQTNNFFSKVPISDLVEL